MYYASTLAAPIDKRKGRTIHSSFEARSVVESQVPQNRREEILEYLKLFGYKPDHTILQVHIPGFFKKGVKGPREAQQRLASARRYGGRTFVIVGRTHDPVIMNLVQPPKSPADRTNPGYVGYLWKGRDPGNKPPHELLPIDFVPMQISYPYDWKQIYATKGFMVGMHVPASFASRKNLLTRALYRVTKTANAKSSWNFIDSVRKFGFDEANFSENNSGKAGQLNASAA